MDPLALIEDYLSDNEQGMLTLITWFQNQVMLLEAFHSPAQDIISEPMGGKLIGTGTRSEPSRHDTGRQSSRTHELHGIPRTAPETDPNHEHDGESQQGTEAENKGRRGISQ